MSPASDSHYRDGEITAAYSAVAVCRMMDVNTGYHISTVAPFGANDTGPHRWIDGYSLWLLLLPLHFPDIYEM